MTIELIKRRCKACEPGSAALTDAAADMLLAEIPGWKREGKEISRTYDFKDFHHTMAFVNAVAYISHQEDHHPDMQVGYNKCTLRYSTHSIGGLSENDFICAAKVSALIA